MSSSVESDPLWASVLTLIIIGFAAFGAFVTVQRLIEVIWKG